MNQSISKPRTGSYIYHYKHDPAKGYTHHAYFVLGTGWDTEGDVYRSPYLCLYDETGYLEEGDFPLRISEMFGEMVEKDGELVQRFTEITDPDLIAKLRVVRDEKLKELWGD